MDDTDSVRSIGAREIRAESAKQTAEKYLSAEGALIPESITARKARARRGEQQDANKPIAMHVTGKWVARRKT